MRKFMDEDFLLKNETAKKLYHSYAEHTPILDYHCHIDPREIAADRKFKNITELWLLHDHYKWRYMRSCGVEEYYITGEATDKEKFMMWAKCLGRAIGNPLYHWSHLELKRYFQYDGILNEKTAEEVWEHCNRMLAEGSMSVRNIIKKSGVALLCTTDDPVDSLQWHAAIAADKDFDIQVLPAWRPDKAIHIEKNDFPDYLARLSETSGVEIDSFASFKEALNRRMDYFEKAGCSVSDHALEYVMYEPAEDEEIERILKKRLSNDEITQKEKLKFKTAVMLFLGKEYHKRSWVMQLHFGCKRDNNTIMYDRLGADSGYDSINNFTPAAQLADFLNALAKEEHLPKTILYSLNPNDNQMIGTILGCFQDSSAISKIQQGSAWWFNDHKTGMREQLISLANLGNLSGFIGMLTDSRSFLSYVRHEYFRRILCNLLGEMVEDGEFPADYETVGGIAEDISYYNAVKYFGFPL